MNIQKYKILLNYKDEFITILEEDFKEKNNLLGPILLGIILFGVFIINIGLGLMILILWIIFVNLDKKPNYEQEISDLREKIKQHNYQIFKNKLTEEIKSLGIDEIEKEINIFESLYEREKIVINDKNKVFAYVNFRLNSKGEKESKSIGIKYTDIIKYAFLDKSTTEQIATSKTSSNSGKSLGGAVASQILVGNATVGAVIGGSGSRETETIYKTRKHVRYQITIYLNRLNDSLININTSEGRCANEIISTLEYILKHK